MAITRLGPNTVNLTSAVTGTLPVANGGTALTSGFVNGSTQGFSSVYMPGDLAISGDGHISASGTGAALSIRNTGASGSGIVTDVTSGNIQVDKTGFYLVVYQFTGNITSGDDIVLPYIRTYNGSSTTNHAYGYVDVHNAVPADNFTQVIHAIVDVTDTSTVKFRMSYSSATNITLYGTGQSVTSMSFLRLGDT